MAKTLKELFEHTLKDIYSSETLLLQAMPKMLSAARDPELKKVIESHIKETQGQIDRVKEVAKMCNIDPEGVTCEATVGLVKEAQEHLEEFAGEPSGDAAIIASAQKNEHYEIANYGTMITWAQQLGYEEVVELFRQTIAEEEAADKKLGHLARSGANQAALADHASTGGPVVSPSVAHA